MSDWATPRTSPVKVRGYAGPGNARTSRRMMERDSPLRRVDWILAAAVVGLCFIGTLLVWSATKHQQISEHLDPNAFLKKNILNISLGLCLAVATMLIDYRSIRAYAPIVFGASVFGLLVVLSPIGKTVNGAHSWIFLPAGFQIQPSEYAKVALVVGMAMILGKRRTAR